MPQPLEPFRSSQCRVCSQCCESVRACASQVEPRHMKIPSSNSHHNAQRDEISTCLGCVKGLYLTFSNMSHPNLTTASMRIERDRDGAWRHAVETAVNHVAILASTGVEEANLVVDTHDQCLFAEQHLCARLNNGGTTRRQQHTNFIHFSSFSQNSLSCLVLIEQLRTEFDHTRTSWNSSKSSSSMCVAIFQIRGG